MRGEERWVRRGRVRTVELQEPAADAVKGGAAGDVVDEERAEGAAVVGGGDGAEELLAGGVPNLGLDDLAVDLETAGGELDADGGLGLEAELVLGEAGEEVGLADAGVADEHHLEEVVVVVLRPVPASVGSHCFPSLPFPSSGRGWLLLAC